MSDETREFDIVAQDVDSEQDCGFNVRFDRPYSMFEEWPVAEDAVAKAVGDAYNWYPTSEMNMALDEGQVVGRLIVDENGEYVRTELVE